MLLTAETVVGQEAHGNQTSKASPPKPTTTTTPTPAPAFSTAPPAIPSGPRCGKLNEWETITTSVQMEKLKGCVVYEGSLKIMLIGNKDLPGLESLARVDQSLEITVSPDLETLKGLDSLQSVGDKLFIHENPKLVNLNGLEKFAFASSGVLIYDNPHLASISGLSALSTINPKFSFPFGLHIYRNPKLTSLEGLGALKVVGNVLELHSLPQLVSLDGLPANPSSAIPLVNLTIASMARLTNITALSGFRVLDITGAEKTARLNISANAALTSLDGLNGVGAAKGVIVENNPMLNSVKALGSVKSWAGPVSFTKDWSLCDYSGINVTAKAQVKDAVFDTCDPSKAKAAAESLLKESAASTHFPPLSTLYLTGLAVMVGSLVC
ncbi:MAG: hypothetical protein DHS80DRAFT_33109 [Piptocephalis tieghemiana]|nr:MAG: hypothetical protein DHS80DRAFT_33109 [Piptocephalis tieghemiana]